MRVFLIIVYLLIIVFGVTFAALNANPVSVNLYIASYSLPVSVLIICSLGIGLLLGFFLFYGRYWRIKRNLRKTEKQLELVKKEIKNLRSIPLTDKH